MWSHYSKMKITHFNNAYFCNFIGKQNSSNKSKYITFIFNICNFKTDYI